MSKLLFGTLLISTLLFGSLRNSEAQWGQYTTIPKYERDRRELPTYKQHRFYSAIPPSDEYGQKTSIDVSISTANYIPYTQLPYGDVSIELYPDDFRLFGHDIGLCGRVDVPFVQYDLRDMVPRVSLGPKLDKLQKEGKLYWRPRIEFYGYKPHRLTNYTTFILGKKSNWFVDSHNGIGRKIRMEDGFQRLTDEIGFNSYTTVGYYIDEKNRVGASVKFENGEFSDFFLRYNRFMKEIGNEVYAGFGIDDKGHLQTNVGLSLSPPRSKNRVRNRDIRRYNRKIERQRLETLQE